MKLFKFYLSESYKKLILLRTKYREKLKFLNQTYHMSDKDT